MRYTSSDLYDKLASAFDGLHNFTDKLDDKTKGKIKCILLLLTLVVIGGIMLVFNIVTPLVFDDFNYSFGQHGRVTGIVDIIKTQYGHYFSWGGRAVVHVIAQSLLYIPLWLADTLNSLAYVVYCVLMYYHVIGRSQRHSLFVLASICMLTIIFQPAFGETCLWLVGSANYLWGTIIILAFLLPYRLYDGAESKGGALKALAMLLFGLIAGWTNENTAAALLVMQVLFIVSYRLRSIKIPAWAIIGLVTCVVGYLFMILAPGNYARSEVIGVAGTVNAISVIKAFIFATLGSLETMGVIILAFVASLVLFIATSQSKEDKVRVTLLASIYTIGTAACLYVMVFSPFFPTRSWFGIVTLAVIALGVVLYNLDYSITYLRRLKLYTSVLLLLLFIKTLYVAYEDIVHLDNVWKEREAIIDASRVTGDTVVFEVYYKKTRFTVSDDEFIGNAMSRYYNANIKIVPTLTDSLPSL